MNTPVSSPLARPIAEKKRFAINRSTPSPRPSPPLRAGERVPEGRVRGSFEGSSREMLFRGSSTRRAFLKGGASLALAVAGTGGLALPLRAAGRPVKIQLSTLVQKDTSVHQILKSMAAKWQKAPGPGITVTFHTDGVMGSEADMIRRMRIGQLQAAVLTAAGLAGIDPALSALQKMPLAFRSLDEVVYVRTRLFPKLQQRLREKDFVLLCLSDAGWVRYFSKVKATVPADFQKLKLFATAGDKEYIEVMREIGFRPVPLEYQDILTGLATGNMIEALASAPFYALAGQFYTQAKHMVEVNWVPLVGGLVIHRKVWDLFPPETQNEMFKIAQEAGEQIQRQTRLEADEAVVAMRKRGLAVHSLDAPAKEAWEQFARSLEGKVRGRLVPAETFDEVHALIKEFRAGQPSPPK